MRLYTAAIGARHKLTRRWQLKAGTIEAPDLKTAQDAALTSAGTKYPPAMYDEHMVNVQEIPQRMLDAHHKQAAA